MVFLFLTRSYTALDHRDSFSEEWSFSDVGRAARDHDGQLQFYRGAKWRFPLTRPDLRSLIPTTTPSRPRSHASALAHIHPREVRIAFSVRSLPKESPATVQSGARCGRYRFQVPAGVVDCLSHFHNFQIQTISPSRDRLEFAQNAVTENTSPASTDFINLDGKQPMFPTLFINFDRAETLGIVLNAHSRSRTIVEGASQVMLDDWYVRAFFTPTILNHLDSLGILAALERSQLFPHKRDDIKFCRDGGHVHLVDVGGTQQPVVFPIQAGDEDASQRAIHVWASVSATSGYAQDTYRPIGVDDDESDVLGHFRISVDLVGFEKTKPQALPQSIT